jgi:molybdopterin/thiamine biosynthesis adenylyltransferase
MSSAYRTWFERTPDRFANEASILKTAGFQLQQKILEDERRVVFVGRSKADPSRELQVTFPNSFPSAAPKIADTRPSKLLARHHRIDTRELCLFGFNQNRWSATMSVADALQEAEALISKFKDRGEVSPSEPPEPITRAIGYAQGAAILIPPPISTFTKFAELKFNTGTFRLRFVKDKNGNEDFQGRGIVTEAYFGDQHLKASVPFTDWFHNRGTEIKGDWFYLEKPPTQEEINEIARDCMRRAKGVKKSAVHWMAMIFDEEMVKAGQWRRTWLVLRGNERMGLYIRTFPYIHDERDVRIPGLESLREKAVTLIGCGSLGSKMAANLAASGLKKFNLIDCDYFEPHNSVRHQLGVPSFGLNKAHALLGRLASLNPEAALNSTTFDFQVASTSSVQHEESFHEMLKISDLIIDATGMHAVSHFLNMLSFELKIPVIFASVTNGAWGGDVVRIFPGKTPCYICWCDQYHDTSPPGEPKPETDIFAPGCDQPTFTGTTHDLDIVASLATSMAIDTLLASGNNFSFNYARWSRRNADNPWLYKTEFLSTQSRPRCRWCDS